MKLKTAKKVAAIFDEVEEMYPKKSFEWLLQMSSDTVYHRFGFDIAPYEVVEALAQVHDALAKDVGDA